MLARSCAVRSEREEGRGRRGARGGRREEGGLRREARGRGEGGGQRVLPVRVGPDALLPPAKTAYQRLRDLVCVCVCVRARVLFLLLCPCGVGPCTDATGPFTRPYSVLYTRASGPRALYTQAFTAGEAPRGPGRPREAPGGVSVGIRSCKPAAALCATGNGGCPGSTPGASASKLGT